jgi:regulator of nucleoside diphosphate kinase
MTQQQMLSVHDNVVITEQDFDRLGHLASSARYERDHRMLQAELERSRVVAATTVPRNVVTMNSRVRVRDLRQDETETYTVVYPDDVDVAAGMISVLAPLGIALLGARVGQVVKFAAPAGVRRLKIEKILYQPEAAGDLHL